MDRTSKLIESINDIYGDQYDCSMTVYTGYRDKVQVRCIRHDHIFIQRPDLLKAGHGCQRCGREKTNEGNTYTENDFRNRFVSTFGTDLTLISFTNCKNPVTVECPHHGIFTKRATDLLTRKRGCSKCTNRKRKTAVEFIEQARNKHGDRYQYDKLVYRNNKTKVIITCPKHGEFEQGPNHHLRGNIGCTRCAIEKQSVSKPEQAWLDSILIPKNARNIFMKIDDRRAINVDGVNFDNNTVYLFHGDFWHGNPVNYPPSGINPMTKTTFGALHTKTIETEARLINAGYRVVSIWESQWIEQNGGRYYSYPNRFSPALKSSS